MAGLAFAGAEAHPDFAAVTARLKSGPDTKLETKGVFQQPASTTVLQKTRSAKRTTRELPEQGSRDDVTETGNGPRVMPLCASRVDGTAVAFQVRISASGPREPRGKNGSVLPRGTHRQLCTRLHDDEIRANLALHNDRAPVLA